MTEEEKQTMRRFVREAMEGWNLQGEAVRMAISQAVFRAVGYTEMRMLEEVEKHMEPNRFNELERKVTS